MLVPAIRAISLSECSLLTSSSVIRAFLVLGICLEFDGSDISKYTYVVSK